MESKNIIVKLYSIFNDNTGDDPGDALEIYGRFDAARIAFDLNIGEIVTLVSFNLFDRSGGNPLNISEGTAFIIDSIAQLEIFQGEFLQITGNIGEQDDFGPNDNLGGVDIRIPFDRIKSGPVEQLSAIDSERVFEESDQRVKVKMSLQVT
jgi:hypothetical protein